jgi:hypothetical protein
MFDVQDLRTAPLRATVMMTGSRGLAITVPRKLLADPAAGSPVIAAVAADASDVRSSGSAVPPSERQLMRMRARRTAECEYARDAFVRRIADVLRECVEKRGTAG